MLGSQFVRDYARVGLPAREAAAIASARQGGTVAWPWIDLDLASAAGDRATLRVQSDVLAIGTPDDFVRLPTTPATAQAILNDSAGYQGCLMPTPWLAYQTWRAATVKLAPTALVPNPGADLDAAARHSALVDGQVAGRTGLVAGQKKDVVVSNLYRAGHVLIFGWYRPPPAPDTLDDRTPITNPTRQPVQPRSNVHGAFYVDYSHGVRAVHGLCTVNGAEMLTEDLYRHPRLSALVSDEGPVKVTRYPSVVAPVLPRPAVVPPPGGLSFAPSEPRNAAGDLGLAALLASLGRRP